MDSVYAGNSAICGGCKDASTASAKANREIPSPRLDVLDDRITESACSAEGTLPGLADDGTRTDIMRACLLALASGECRWSELARARSVP